jgi:DNA-binding LacI/PurR family transcriptional regulator
MTFPRRQRRQTPQVRSRCRYNARLKDILRDLDLSIVTVSKVLRDHPNFGAEPRDRVLKRMKEVNYQPNPAVRS